MGKNIIKLIVKREKRYSRKKWRLITFALITISFIFTSIMALSLNDINNFNNMVPYQTMITDVNQNIYNQIEKNRERFKIVELGTYIDLGISMNNKTKIIYVDNVGSRANGFKIDKGTFPRLSNEVAVYGQKNIQIGDKINLTYIDSYNNERVNRKFKVTAILKSEIYGRENDKTIIVSKKYANDIVGNSNRNDLYINFKTDSKSEIKAQTEKLKNKYNLDEKQIALNEPYIDGILGDFNQIIFILLAGIICCILSRSIVYTIYNIFYNERLVYLKKLKLVGMTKSDFLKMNRYEIRKVFTNVIWGQILAVVLLIIYMKLKISISITVGCLIYVSIVIYTAINFATKKQLKELLNTDSLNKSKLDYIVKNLKSIKRNKTSKLYVRDLAKRNNKLYKNRNKLIKKSIILTSIAFIIFTTLFTSVDYDKQISHIYKHGEEYLIYPDMQNIYKQLTKFQKHNILNDELINKIESIKGIERVIVNELVAVNIKDQKGHKFDGIVPINNGKLKKRLSRYLEDGRITDDKVIVNKWRMNQIGLSFRIGTKLYIKESTENKFSTYTVGGIINDRNSGDALYIPNKFTTDYNTSYSLSVITTSGKSSDTVVSKINDVLQDYPQLRLRSYDVQLNDIKSTFEKLLFMILIIIGLLFIVSIVNTINIVNIDLISRDREFALFEVNGMTKSSLRKQLFIEYGSMLIGTILVIFVSSYTLSFLIYKVAEVFLGIGYLTFAYSYISFIIISLITLLVVFSIVLIKIKKQDKNLSDRLK